MNDDAQLAFSVSPSVGYCQNFALGNFKINNITHVDNKKAGASRDVTAGERRE